MKIQHVGRSAHRLKPSQENPREVAFAEQWLHENGHKRTSANTLALLLHSNGDGRLHGDLTQAQATDAATVIQWLGSNVGWSFLNEALKRCGFVITERTCATDPTFKTRDCQEVKTKNSTARAMRRKKCRKCKGQDFICSESGRPWNDCDCGWCERGPSTSAKCPKRKGEKSAG